MFSATTANSITCILFNARSLRNKLPDLRALLNHKKPAVAFITERWLEIST